MEVVVAKVDDTVAPGTNNIGFADVPLFRYGPIEDGRSRGDFAGLQWYPGLNG